MKIQSVVVTLSAVAALAAASTGCNLFGGIDKPGNDAQYLSAAEACMDQGNYACAAAEYAKVTSDTDQALSDESLALLAQSGAKFETFAQTFGSGGNLNPGSAITNLATLLIPTSGQASRLQILGALQNVPKITDISLRGFVRFLSGLSMVAELLSEDATTATFTAADLAQSPTACMNDNTVDVNPLTSCANDGTLGLGSNPNYSDCLAPAGQKMVAGAEIEDGSGNPGLTTATTAQLSGVPTLNMLNAALNEVITALTTEIKGSGSISSGTSGLASGVFNQVNTPLAGGKAVLPNDPTDTEDAPCYRLLLLKQGIGQTN
jgi:hypothetical protein